MPNQKISELTTIITVDNAVDLFPIVDTSANTTKKITPTALKSALALDNVNNTSDANKPVSTAQQDALNAKVTANAAITAGTAPKVTFDAKGLVTSGDSLDETDLPTGINANKIGTGAVSSTEFGYLNGVTSAIQTQIDGKQATLVSGTNIKTINGATVLGAGDLTVTGNPPSGVSGAIQFTNGSAFASDAANLFWDDTNNRLGVGTNAPSATAHFKGSGSTSATTSLLVQNSAGLSSLQVNDAGSVFNNGSGAVATNTAFGNSALIANTTGSNNTALGFQSGTANTTATDNTLLGSQAGSNITTGSLNVVIGSGASPLTSSTTATTIIGQSSTGGFADVVVGRSATGGSSCSVLGNGANAALFSGCVVLGRNATATDNNQFVVGTAAINAGAVTNAAAAQTHYWTIKINGTDYKVLLGT
jgi:hypothetical protein